MSINYDDLESALDWTNAARELMVEAREAVKADSAARMESANEGLAEFIANRTPACPQAVADAVFGVQSEVARAIAEGVIGSIRNRTVQFDAFILDVDRISGELEESADKISLTAVKGLVNRVTTIAEQVKRVRKKVKGLADGVADDVEAVLERLAQLEDELEKLTKGN